MMHITAETWVPLPKQQLFLQSKAFELLYGGAVGGGKTDALLFDVLGLNQPEKPAIEYPKYYALMIRPTMPELRDIISRTKALYPRVAPGAKWRSGTNSWVFPSGAVIEFTYLKDLADAQRFRGIELQYVGWEELTLHPSPEGYLYLLTRVRKGPGLENLNVYVRATTNPDGPGSYWVKEHWRIPDDGAATNFTITDEIYDRDQKSLRSVTFSREFIPASLRDNKYLDADYEMRIKMSGRENAKALIEGRWDVVQIEGSYYQEQCEQTLAEGRLTTLPTDTVAPLYSAWDVGVSDYTSVWVFQYHPPYYDFLHYFQDNGKPIDYYIKWLKNLDGHLGTMFLPHDAKHSRLGATRIDSISGAFRDCGVFDIQIVPKINDINVGIQKVRALFPACRFDREGTKEGWNALLNYRKKYNTSTNSFESRPVHNQWSHGADAFRQVAQANLGSLSVVDHMSMAASISHSDPRKPVGQMPRKLQQYIRRGPKRV